MVNNDLLLHHRYHSLMLRLKISLISLFFVDRFYLFLNIILDLIQENSTLNHLIIIEIYLFLILIHVIFLY
jgi:hypothetical protein